MTKIKPLISLSILVLLSSAVLAMGRPPDVEMLFDVNEDGMTIVRQGPVSRLVKDLPKEPLNQEEKEGIIYTVQEEALAVVLYSKFYDKWKLPIFKKISDSEQTHVQAVALLAKKYDLDKPLVSDKKLIALNKILSSQGERSLAEALKAGAVIEDISIVDLQKLIKHTNQDDIKLVYNCLLRGSRNHLRAFVKKLKTYDVEYAPENLSNKEFNRIISTPHERGPLKGGK